LQPGHLCCINTQSQSAGQLPGMSIGEQIPYLGSLSTSHCKARAAGGTVSQWGGMSVSQVLHNGPVQTVPSSVHCHTCMIVGSSRHLSPVMVFLRFTMFCT
jgi:hypothetical protein